MVDDVINEYVKLITRTEPIDDQRVRSVIEDVYHGHKASTPAIVVVKSPTVAFLTYLVAAIKSRSSKRPAIEDIAASIENAKPRSDDMEFLSQRYLKFQGYPFQREHLILGERSHGYTITDVMEINTYTLGMRAEKSILNSDHKNVIGLVHNRLNPFISAYRVANLIVNAFRNDLGLFVVRSRFYSDEFAARVRMCHELVGDDLFPRLYQQNSYSDWKESLFQSIYGYEEICLAEIAIRFGLIPEKEQSEFDPYIQLLKNMMFGFMTRKFCVVCDFPESMHFNENYELHCETGPSMRWRDGSETYHYGGIRVPKHVIMNPNSITIDEINNEPNQEQKQILLERFGYNRYFTNGNGLLLHRDEYGELWETSAGSGIRVVFVENGTVEPDGRRKRYLLAVPRWSSTALEGVAWTYGLTAEDYAKKLVKRT